MSERAFGSTFASLAFRTAKCAGSPSNWRCRTRAPSCWLQTAKRRWTSGSARWTRFSTAALSRPCKRRGTGTCTTVRLRSRSSFLWKVNSFACIMQRSWMLKAPAGFAETEANTSLCANIITSANRALANLSNRWRPWKNRPLAWNLSRQLSGRVLFSVFCYTATFRTPVCPHNKPHSRDKLRVWRCDEPRKESKLQPIKRLPRGCVLLLC